MALFRRLAPHAGRVWHGAAVGMFLVDRRLRFVALNAAQARLHGVAAAVQLGQGVGGTNPGLAALLEPALRQVLTSGLPVQGLEWEAEDGRVWLLGCHPVRNWRAQLAWVGGTAVEITQRKRHELRDLALAQEVEHRAQNALSIVRGLVRLAAHEASTDTGALVRGLEARIGAMARAQALLLRAEAPALALHEVVRQELAPHAGRCEATGPALHLSIRAVQPFTLVLHELVANAALHGALTQPSGRVRLEWRSAANAVEFRWTEQDGPRLAAPPLPGLGSMLIDAYLGKQLAGGIEREWRPEGLHCRLHLGAQMLEGAAANIAVRHATGGRLGS